MWPVMCRKCGAINHDNGGRLVCCGCGRTMREGVLPDGLWFWIAMLLACVFLAKEC